MGSHPNPDASMKPDREKRLAEALKANLKRRKAQSRQRAASDESGERSGDPKESG